MIYEFSYETQKSTSKLFYLKNISLKIVSCKCEAEFTKETIKTMKF